MVSLHLCTPKYCKYNREPSYITRDWELVNHFENSWHYQVILIGIILLISVIVAVGICQGDSCHQKSCKQQQLLWHAQSWNLNLKYQCIHKCINSKMDKRIFRYNRNYYSVRLSNLSVIRTIWRVYWHRLLSPFQELLDSVSLGWNPVIWRGLNKFSDDSDALDFWDLT